MAMFTIKCYPSLTVLNVTVSYQTVTREESALIVEPQLVAMSATKDVAAILNQES